MGLPVQRERSDVESGTPEPFSPEMLADPYPAYSAMRERGRIQRTAAGHWLVLGYDEVSQLLADQRFGEAAGRGGRIRLSRTTREGPHRLLGRVDTMLSVDPPEHTRLRRPCEQGIHASERAEDAPAYSTDRERAAGGARRTR